jgi:D-hydroxyproline dehydrogenase subunit beta
MIKKEHTEIAVVGAGIVGLAIAYEAAKRGKKVTVFERNAYSIGASVRNFGTIWPIGQKQDNYQKALYGRQVWMDLAKPLGIEVNPCGSLHLAYEMDEVDVLEEFLSSTDDIYDAEMIAVNEIQKYSNAANMQGLKAAMWSPTELTVTSRQAIPSLANYLEKEMGVTFEFNTLITHIAFPDIQSQTQQWTADKIYVCSGADFETLYPDTYAAAGITKCKLQMMNTVVQPSEWKMGANLCGGLTLRHYASFAHCNNLSKLSQRFDQDEPRLAEYGIHILLSQNSHGQIIIGDSHEYGTTLSPFDSEEINDLILKYLQKIALLPSLKINERWHGIYAKLAGETEFVTSPTPGVTIVNGLGGAGMTLSFGLAKEVIDAEM